MQMWKKKKKSFSPYIKFLNMSICSPKTPLGHTTDRRVWNSLVRCYTNERNTTHEHWFTDALKLSHTHLTHCSVYSHSSTLSSSHLLIHFTQPPPLSSTLLFYLLFITAKKAVQGETKETTTTTILLLAAPTKDSRFSRKDRSVSMYFPNWSHS